MFLVSIVFFLSRDVPSFFEANSKSIFNFFWLFLIYTKEGLGF